MKNFRRDISIRAVLIIMFLTVMVIYISSIGYLVFTNWFSSAKQTTESIAAEMNENIYKVLYMAYKGE